MRDPLAGRLFLPGRSSLASATRNEGMERREAQTAFRAYDARHHWRIILDDVCQ
jgi:hypothetical protein